MRIKQFQEMTIQNKRYKGKKLLDQFEVMAREGYFNQNNLEDKQYGMDIMWYLWCGAKSSLFGKESMTMFERYFLEDKKLMVEKKNAYYKFRDDEEMCNLIFEEFGLDQCESRIVNGHVPVKKRMVKVRLKQMENCLSLMVDFEDVSTENGDCRLYADL